MAVDIAIHALGNAVVGNLPPAAQLPVLGGQIGLAENTNSALIDVAYDVVLVLVATAKLRLDIRRQADAAALNPAASPVILPSEQRVAFSLPAGKWIVKTVAA
jgi:hypothetical protein